jgi:hypothetical protein
MNLEDWGCGLDSSGSKEKPVMDSCEHDNAPSNSIKNGEFFTAGQSTSFSINRPYFAVRGFALLSLGPTTLIKYYRIVL